MSNPRRARAIAVAKVDDSAKLFRLRLLLLTLGATAALLALPTLF
jgi:hypothetical protein